LDLIPDKRWKNRSPETGCALAIAAGSGLLTGTYALDISAYAVIGAVLLKNSKREGESG
jgi:hypothetical protein